MKCIKVLEQTTEEIFSQSSLLMAQLRFLRNLAQDCTVPPNYDHYGLGEKEALLRECQPELTDCGGDKEAEKPWC